MSENVHVNSVGFPSGSGKVIDDDVREFDKRHL